MQQSAEGERDGRVARRMFAVFAAGTLLPVVVLGAVLSWVLQVRATESGLAEARRQAGITAVALTPLLTAGDLDEGLSPLQQEVLARSIRLAAAENRVVLMQVYARSGRLVFTADRRGALPLPPVGARVEDELTEALAGRVSTSIDGLDEDDGRGGGGVRVVEVYQPLRTQPGGPTLGAVELYLPYDPIADSAAAGQRAIRTVLFAGLAALWAVLLLIARWVSRRLRRSAAVNAFLANSDPLTGLPNRVSFRRRASAALGTAKSSTAVAVFDLDRFKEVNDALGHRNGDELLRQLAARLTANVRPGDTIARLGGDEFGVIVRDVTDHHEAEEVLRRLRGVLSEGITVGDLPLAVEASVGFALAPQDGRDVDALLRFADVAIYAAKRRHLGVAPYDEADNPHDGAALTLMGELPRAINDDELVLHYQPKAQVRTGRVEAVEALVRWQHPELGLLFPDAFIPAAEQTELIEPLTFWVLERALTDLAAIDPEGRLRVAVNVSARSLARPDFAPTTLDVIARCGVSPDRVILEMTETALLVDPERAAAALSALAEAGLRISIDDFGAGQTSLGYLATLPVDEVKIDKSFVLDMALNPRNAAIVRSVVELAHSLGFTVTAEGVETADSLTDLRAMRCDAAQGYLLSRPVPPERVREHITRVARTAALPV